MYCLASQASRITALPPTTKEKRVDLSKSTSNITNDDGGGGVAGQGRR
jgi:hypothetical protein